jgi:hypothetical protein
VGRIVVMNAVTLDGVFQGPGRPDEDTRGGFTQGGWGRRYQTADDPGGQATRERREAGGGLAGWLFVRRTYEGLLSYWNQRPDSPFGPMLNAVALNRAVAWPRSPVPSRASGWSTS